MNFIQRLGFYLGGAVIGSIIVYFILDKKETSFCYLPNCRILKDIRSKKRILTPNVQEYMQNKKLDTSLINYTYNNGDVDLSKSNTKLKSCKIYHIDSEFNNKKYEFIVENCDSIATIKSINIK